MIIGNDSANTLTGGAGTDTLNGGTGNEILDGGTGTNVLLGGLGSDTFVFNAISDSTTVSTTWDVVTDFTRGQDKINLRGIDAFGASLSNDAFVWKGTAAFNSTTTGEARYQLCLMLPERLMTTRLSFLTMMQTPQRKWPSDFTGCIT